VFEQLKEEVAAKDARIVELQAEAARLQEAVTAGDAVRKRAVHMSAHIEQWEAQVCMPDVGTVLPFALSHAESSWPVEQKDHEDPNSQN